MNEIQRNILKSLDYSDRFLHISEVETITGLSSVTLWREERRGDFPKRLKISEGRVGWRLSEINEWLDSRSPSGKQKPAGSGRLNSKTKKD